VAGGFQTQVELHARLQFDDVFGAAAQAVEVVGGRQHGEIAELLTGSGELLGRTGEQQSVQRCPWLCRQLLRVLIVELTGGGGERATGERLAAERLRPTAGWIAELPGQ